jgi:hypothetical protein
MRYQIKGLSDICTVLLNQRNLGGALEAESIRLRTGEEYQYPVIVSLERAGDQFYSMGLVTFEGKHIIVHTGEVGQIHQVRHVDLKDLHNSVYRQQRQQELLRYLDRLCEVNSGFITDTFRKEALRIVEDIGWENIEERDHLKFIRKDLQKIRVS